MKQTLWQVGKKTVTQNTRPTHNDSIRICDIPQMQEGTSAVEIQNPTSRSFHYQHTFLTPWNHSSEQGKSDEHVFKNLCLSAPQPTASAAPTKFTWQGTQPFANKQLLASNDLRSQKIAPQPRCTARHSCTRICFPSNVVISAPVAKKIQNGSFPHND